MRTNSAEAAPGCKVQDIISRGGRKLSRSDSEQFQRLTLPPRLALPSCPLKRGRDRLPPENNLNELHAHSGWCLGKWMVGIGSDAFEGRNGLWGLCDHHAAAGPAWLITRRRCGHDFGIRDFRASWLLFSAANGEERGKEATGNGEFHNRSQFSSGARGRNPATTEPVGRKGATLALFRIILTLDAEDCHATFES